MPTSGNIYQSYDFGFAAGAKNREDLLNIMVNIAPWETPLFSTAPKTRCTHTTHEWIEDTLAATDGSGGGYSEGQDFSAKAVQTRQRQSNWTQIFRKDIAVSETQQTVNPAGVSNEYAYQIESALKEIARNVETRCFDTSNSGVTGASATQRLFKTLNDFLSAASTNNVNVSATPLFLTANASGTYTKGVVDRLLRLCFQSGGMPRRVYMTPFGKESLLASLSNVNNAFNYRNVAASENAIYFNIEVYQSAFGTIEIVADRFIPTATAQSTAANAGGRIWALEQPKVRIAFLRPVSHKPLPPNGDSVRGMVRGEMTLEVQGASSVGVAHAYAYNVYDA